MHQELFGIPGATGVAMGRVRIARGPRPVVSTGDVLVAEEVDAGLRAALPRAAALVLDGRRDHAEAIVAARRFHVPALLLADAGSRLQDGDLVEIDGYAGTVRFLAAGSRMVA